MKDMRLGFYLNYDELKKFVPDLEYPSFKKNLKKQEYRLYLSFGFIIEY